MRGPDGKFAATTPDPAAPAAPAPVAAAAPVAPVVPKVLDAVNDPIPPNAKPETRERITTLANMVKEQTTAVQAVTAERDQARTDFDTLYTHIQSAGATVEQFRESMHLVALLNSPHQHEQMEALQYVQSLVKGLSNRLGQVPPGADPLEGQADLIQAVQANRMPRAYAEEVARARRLTAATEQQQSDTREREQQNRLQTRATQEGQDAVRAVEQAFKASDPQYAAKIAVMTADPAYKARIRALPPTQWAGEFAKVYNGITVAAPAPAPVIPAAPRSPTPLRARTPASVGGVVKQPTTQLEAVTAAIRGMTG